MARQGGVHQARRISACEHGMQVIDWIRLDHVLACLLTHSLTRRLRKSGR